MDILRVLAAPDLEVRKKTLNLALDLVSSRNVEEVRRRLSVLSYTSACRNQTIAQKNKTLENLI